MSQERNDRASKNLEVAVGERLRLKRRVAGVSGAELADRMRAFGSYFDAGKVSRLENGKQVESVALRDVVAAAKSLAIQEYVLLLEPAAAALLDAYYEGLAAGGEAGALAGVLTWATEQARSVSTPGQNSR